MFFRQSLQNEKEKCLRLEKIIVERSSSTTIVEESFSTATRGASSTTTEYKEESSTINTQQRVQDLQKSVESLSEVQNTNSCHSYNIIIRSVHVGHGKTDLMIFFCCDTIKPTFGVTPNIIFTAILMFRPHVAHTSCQDNYFCCNVSQNFSFAKLYYIIQLYLCLSNTICFEYFFLLYFHDLLYFSSGNRFNKRSNPLRHQRNRIFCRGEQFYKIKNS